MRSFVLLAVFNLICLVVAQKNPDEDRPYKFGFNIEGHQHRKEEKDDKGIIRGEYGFITADGYYRVTVYETDEQGRFKIISQKNYYVGFPPGNPITTPSSNKHIQVPATTNRPTKIAPGHVETTTTKHSVGGKVGASCGSCLLPTTTQKPKEPIFSTTKFAEPIKRTTVRSIISTTRTTPYPAKPTTTTTPKPVKPTTRTPPASTSFRDLIIVKSAPSYGHEPDPPSRPFESPSAFKNTPSPDIVNLFTTKKPQPQVERESDSPSGLQEPTPALKQKLDQSPRIKSEIQKVRDQSTPTINANENNDLIYKFNYTVGFHGHHESGYRNGNKLGKYFVNGRDGVNRRVEYTANEFGYQPNITFTQLEENDTNRPKEDTEKSYGLKGYEFKWFLRK